MRESLLDGVDGVHVHGNAVDENSDDCEEHKKRGFTPPHLGGEDEILNEMQVLVAVAEVV